jgi:hypothetical protein
MKKTISIGLATLVIFAVNWVGCGTDANVQLNDQQKAAKILQEGSPWGGSGKVDVVSVPSGIDPNDLSLLSISFTTSGEPDWIHSSIDASGADTYFITEDATWAWGTTTGTDVISLDGASSSEFTSVDVQEQEIRLTFEINSSGGRIEGIDGSYTVSLGRN